MKEQGKSRSKNWRTLYTAIRAMDGRGLSCKRKILEKLAKKILRKKEIIGKKVRQVRRMENFYSIQRSEYDSLVATVTNKLRYRESKSFQDRQKELDDVYREWEKTSQQNGIAF